MSSTALRRAGQSWQVTFIGINSGAEREAHADATPLEMLQGCHARIRHFMQLSRTLATATDAPPEEISDAARALRNYFHLALPLHEADENESLSPRLCLLPPGNLVREAAEAMVEQHRAIDELVAELVALCERLQRLPAQLAELAPRMGEINQALGKIFDAHLTLEESVIFPALPIVLTPGQMSEVLREMQGRRRAEVNGIHLVQ
jgi:uncharacterized coiled-coil protein SlyX